MRQIVVFSALVLVSSCSLLTELNGFSNGGPPKPDSGELTDGAGATVDAGDAGDDGDDDGGADGAPSGGLVDGGNGDGGNGDGGNGDGSTPAAEPLLVVAGGHPEQFIGPAFDTTYYAPLRGNGGLGEWKPGPKLPLAQSMEMRVAAANGSIFFLFSDRATSVKRLGDGLGMFTLEPAPAYREATCLVGMGLNVFRLGGKINNVVQDAVDSKDTLTWAPTTKLPDQRYLMGCAASESFVYVVGGKNAAEVHQSSVLVAARTGSTLGAWKSTKPMPVSSYWPRPVVVGSRLFVIGGDLDGVAASTVYVASIQTPSGELTDWALSPMPLPVNVSTPGVAVWDNRIVVTAGADSTTGKGTTRTFITTVNPATGALSSWVESTPLPVAMTQHGSAFASP